MNRQLRRANEKSDKRREREQERRKADRRAARVVSSPSKSSKSSSTDKTSDKTPATTESGGANTRPAPGTRRQGLSLAYLVLVVGLIVAQAFLPQQTDPFSLVVHALIYVILGYFLCLWLSRRGVARAFVFTLVAGVVLAVVVEAAKLVTSPAAPEPLFVYLSLPGLLLGTWLGRFVHRQNAR